MLFALRLYSCIDCMFKKDITGSNTVLNYHLNESPLDQNSDQAAFYRPKS